MRKTCCQHSLCPVRYLDFPEMETKNKSKWGSGVYHFVSCYKFIYQNSAHDSCPTTNWGNRATRVNLSKSFPRRQWPKNCKYCEKSVTTKEQASQGLSRSLTYLGDDTRTPSHLLQNLRLYQRIWIPILFFLPIVLISWMIVTGWITAVWVWPPVPGWSMLMMSSSPKDEGIRNRKTMQVPF